MLCIKKLLTITLTAALLLISGMVVASPVPDTGITKCYNETEEIPCPQEGEEFYGQDGNYSINPMSYTKLDENGNALPITATSWSMVRDNVTGLIWENKTDDGSIHDKDNAYTWDEVSSVFIAKLNADNFGGYSDWRLPTITELGTIINYDIPYPGPTVNTNYFKDTNTNCCLSSTTVSYATYRAWGVIFYDGDFYSENFKISHNYVRAVRGGQSAIGLCDNLFINGNGTISDSATGLMWQQDKPDNEMTWKDALSYCENLNLGGYTDWRLPTIKELLSIVDYSLYNPAIDTNIFKDTFAYFYWSSTTDSNYTYSAWGVSFSTGDSYSPGKGSNNYVRAVRGGQSLIVPSETSPGLSCTCNTLGMPLDSTSCFSESELDAGGLWKKAILRKGGEVFAQASLAGSEGGFCVQNLLWETTSGTPITDWSGLYGGLDSVGVEFAAERGDGTEVVLGSKEVKRSQFDVSVTADETFPMAGPQASAAFTASPSGGTAPYTYNWTTIMDYALDGYGHNSWSSTSNADIELPAYGEKYPQYPVRWGSLNNLHQINLQVKDSAGKIAYTKCTATVATPQLTGDPSLSGSGSQLLRGVDVVSGNYHISSTDLSVSGKGPDFVVTRAYNSLNKKPLSSSEIKEGEWSFNLDMRAWFGSHSMGREITISPREDGRKQYFYRELDGSWNTLNPGSFDQLVKNSDGTFTLYTQGNLFYTFADPLSSLNGCLKSISDRDGNAITFTHDADNRIIGAKDASGNNYTITRDTSGRIIKVADFTGREVQYSWNADNMLTDVKNPRGNSTTFSYTDDKLSSITDPLGNTQVTISYNSSGSNAGRVSSVTDGKGNAWTYTYTTVVDANELHGTAVARPATNGVNNNLVFVIDKARTKILERVDSINAGNFRSTNKYRSTDSRSKIAEMALVELSQRPSGTGTEISYSDDGKGNPTKIINGVRTNAGADDPKLTTEAAFDKVAGQTNLTPLKTITRPGVATPTKYDNFTPSGKAESITDPLGNITNRTYQTNGLLSQSTDPRSYSTNYTYNADGTLSKVTDALGNSTNYTYDSLGRVKTTTNPRGQVTTYTYDANDNIIKSEVTADGVTLTTTSVYDDADNLVSVTDPRGNTVNYDYDTLNRKVAERYKIAGVERTRKFEYDAMGRLAQVINEKDDASETRFDARGKVLQEINPLSQTISYTYDENSNLLTVTDAENRTLTYQYDTLDRKTKVTDALGNYEEYRYNAQGLLDQMLDSRGFWTFYKYDALGRMTEVRQMAGTTPDIKDIITKAGYDANGNMVSVTDPNGKITTYQYDALNRMTSLKDPENRTWTFTYDANGSMLTRTTPDNKTTTYIYDGFDRVKEVRYPDGINVGYTYDANGNRLTMTDSSGLTKYTYDEQNRLTSVTDSFGNAVGYGYDAVGLIQELTYPGSKKVQYEHDAAGRLASLKDWLNHTTSYTRDNNGAVKEILYGNGTQVKKEYDNAGRLVDLYNLTKTGNVISSHQLTLDGGGNPLSANLDLPLMPAKFGKAAEMIYDASNRLTKVGDSTITHDTDGRLVADPTNGDPIQYAFNAKDLITSITKAGVLTDSYAYDGDGKRISRTTSGQTTRYVNDPTGGDLYRLLAETNASNAVQRYYIYGEGLVSQISGSTHHYYHFDQSGNTLALTNDAGEITDTYAYEPFGSTTTQGSTVNPFKFVGQYGVMDDGNGLHQMRARYYRSDLRRFVSLDSLYGEITDPMALNRYQYVSGNPMVGVDPSGKWILPVLQLIGLALTFTSGFDDVNIPLPPVGQIFKGGSKIVNVIEELDLQSIAQNSAFRKVWLNSMSKSLKSNRANDINRFVDKYISKGVVDKKDASDAYTYLRSLPEMRETFKGYDLHHLNFKSIDPKLAVNPANLFPVTKQQHILLHSSPSTGKINFSKQMYGPIDIKKYYSPNVLQSSIKP
ncbi:MAG: DUF1566 domain-containing protein [Desulfamplus sp.]